MLITVTQEHIDKGRIAIKSGERVSENCAVSKALMDRFKVEHVDINHNQINYIGLFPDEVILDHAIPLPKEVDDWIKDYDFGRPVTPFSFELDLSGGVDGSI